MSRFEITRYPKVSTQKVLGLRVQVKDLDRNDPIRNDVIQLRNEPGQWRVFLHGEYPLKTVYHKGTLRSALALYTLLRSGTS